MDDYSIIIAMIIISGIGSMVCGIMLFIDIRKRIGRTNSATGKITEIQFRSFFGNDILSFFPTVAFSDSHGNQYNFVSPIGSLPSFDKVGDTVKVFYNPYNPSDAEIGSGLAGFSGRFLLPFALGIGAISSFFSSLLLSVMLIILNAILP